jgi:hypothetical protein
MEDSHTRDDNRPRGDSRSKSRNSYQAPHDRSRSDLGKDEGPRKSKGNNLNGDHSGR